MMIVDTSVSESVRVSGTVGNLAFVRINDVSLCVIVLTLIPVSS